MPRASSAVPAGDGFFGGWAYEKAMGKDVDKPPNLIPVCTRCQWVKKNAQQEEPDRGEWCADCLAGLELGHAPAVGVAKPQPVRQDSAFF